LLKAYKKGDNSALEKLMLLLYKDLFWLSYSYIKDKMLAEDIVSETFIKLIEKIYTIKNENNLNGYLRTIVINKSLNLIRDRNKEIVSEDIFLEQFSSDNQLDEDLHIRYALSTLTEKERELLLLHSYGYTLKEISKKTKYTFSQVRTLLEKAKNIFLQVYRKS